MKQQHTPGPWIAYDWSFGSRWAVQRHLVKGSSNIGRKIADINNCDGGHDATEEEEANAYLVAASPDLLTACERALSFARGCVAGVIGRVNEVHRLNVIDAINAAIAKAKGGAS